MIMVKELDQQQFEQLLESNREFLAKIDDAPAHLVAFAARRLALLGVEVKPEQVTLRQQSFSKNKPLLIVSHGQGTDESLPEATLSAESTFEQATDARPGPIWQHWVEERLDLPGEENDMVFRVLEEFEALGDPSQGGQSSLGARFSFAHPNAILMMTVGASWFIQTTKVSRLMSGRFMIQNTGQFYSCF